MKQYNENFVSMCKAVQSLLERHAAEWASQPVFVGLVSDFEASMSALGLAMEGGTMVSSGASKDKLHAKKEAVLQVVKLSERARVYAMEEGLGELQGQIRVTKTAMLRLADTVLLAKLRSMHTRLAGVVVELEDYGVVAADLVVLKGLTDAYESLIARPRMLIVERKGYNNTAIPELLKALRMVLRKMDLLINVFAPNSWVTGYRNARMVVDAGQRRQVLPSGDGS